MMTKTMKNTRSRIIYVGEYDKNVWANVPKGLWVTYCQAHKLMYSSDIDSLTSETIDCPVCLGEETVDEWLYDKEFS